MRTPQTLVLSALGLVFLTTFFVSSGITGFVANDELRLSVDGVQAYETEALISWSTSREALATLVVNGERTAFSNAEKFSKSIEGLAPGTSYDFVVRACDASACKEKSSSFTTKGGSQGAITGAIIGGEGVTKIVKTSASLAIYVLLGMVAVVVAGRIGYQTYSSRDPMPGLINKTEKHLDAEQYREAYDTYSTARKTFMTLEEDAKAKHYEKLMGIYQNLKRYSIMKEAQSLTEKYEKGTITREEMRRLNDLLAS